MCEDVSQLRLEMEASKFQTREALHKLESIENTRRTEILILIITGVNFKITKGTII